MRSQPFPFPSCHDPSILYYIMSVAPRILFSSWTRADNLRGDADDAASGAETSVTGLLAVWVAALAEIVGAAVDDDGALDYGGTR